MADTKPITLLAEFNTLIATDVGIGLFMESKFDNVKYLREFKYQGVDVMKNRMLWRNIVNPLSVLVKDDYIDNIDELYIDIYQKYKEEIYLKSIPTDILRFINTASELAGVNKIDILCNNDMEMEIIKKLVPDSNPLLYKNLGTISTYMAFFIYSYESLYDRKDILNMGLYIPAYKFNLNDDFTIRPDFFMLDRSVVVRMIDVYNDTSIPSIVSGHALETILYSSYDEEKGEE